MAQTQNSPQLRFKEIRFDGRLRTAPDPSTIGPNDLQKCINLRPSDAGLVGVSGDSKINSTSLGQAIKSGIHYRKGRPSESHVIADGADFIPYSITAAVPGTGNFGSALDTAGVQKGRYAIAPTGMLARCTGDRTLLYGGTKFPCNAFIDMPTTGEAFDYSDQISNELTDSGNVATIHASSNVATFYIGSPLPISGFYIDVNTANTVVTTMAVYYWNGSALTAVSSLVDGTTSGGISLAQDGWVTFYGTDSYAKQSVVEKRVAYWYKVTVTGSSDFDGVPKISSVYLRIPMQKIKDLWDGELIPCPAFLIQQDSGSVYVDATTNVYDKYYDASDNSTFADIDASGLGVTGRITVGSPVPLFGVEFSFSGSSGNNVDSTIDEFDYWDGDSWVSNLATLTDGTLNSDDSESCSQTGWITWAPPTANTEKPSTSLPGSGKIVSSITGQEVELSKSVALYYYRFSWTASFADSTKMYAVRLIPAQSEIIGCSFPVQHGGRLFLCDFLYGNRNAARYSSADSANVFNGKDSDTLYFGGDEPLVAGASIYNRFGSTESDLLVLAKHGETWCLSGNDPEKWVKFCISESIGCVAPDTMLAVNVPSKEVTPGVSSNAAMWVSSRGVELFTGSSFRLASDDIADLFDPNHANYIGDAVLPTLSAFYDQKRDEYHLVIPDSAEWVLSLKYGKWFQVERGTGNYLSGGIPVQDTSGINHVYGFDSSGYLRRLEYGTTFNGSDQVFTLKTACLALDQNRIGIETFHRGFKFVQKAKNATTNSVSVTVYKDASSTGVSLDAISTAVSGGRLKDYSNMYQLGPCTFWEYEFSLTTNDETDGFEPLFLGIFWEPARADIRE